MTDDAKARLVETMREFDRRDDAEAESDPTHSCKRHDPADVGGLAAWFRKVTYRFDDDMTRNDDPSGWVCSEAEAVDALNWVETTLREDSRAGIALRDRLGLPHVAAAAPKPWHYEGDVEVTP